MRIARSWASGVPASGLIAAIGALIALSVNCWGGQPPNDQVLDQALARILDAQPGSVHDDEISRAWKILAGAAVDDLPRVFRALDKANPLAANWINMGLDRIVASETDRGRTIPADLLEETALDTMRSLITRKTALDLLSRAAPRRMHVVQAKLINDPEAELRRPAVQSALDEARKLADRGAGEAEQLAAWRRLLGVARDQDQVMAIARAMKRLGQEVDLAARFGYLTDWYVVGPFDNTDGGGFDREYPPESLTLADFHTLASAPSKKTYTGKSGSVSWKKVTAKAANGDVDLNKEIDKLRDVVGYGATLFVSDRRQEVDVRLRVQNSFKIWLNGRLLMSQPIGHTGNSFDMYKVRAELNEGENLFVIKSCQVDMRGVSFFDTWHFSVRVCDSTGGAILPANSKNHKGSNEQ